MCTLLRMRRSHFPRIRGDDPLAILYKELFPCIFPVFAGMIPECIALPARVSDFPRIRGDDPEYVRHH